MGWGSMITFQTTFQTPPYILEANFHVILGRCILCQLVQARLYARCPLFLLVCKLGVERTVRVVLLTWFKGLRVQSQQQADTHAQAQVCAGLMATSQLWVPARQFNLRRERVRAGGGKGDLEREGEGSWRS